MEIARGTLYRQGNQAQKEKAVATAIDQWQEQDAVFSNTNGVPFHLTTVAVQHNHLYYDIVFYSPTVYYDEAMQKYFQPMFDSFQFQS